MHPELVAGARVGFNEKLAMGSWGQGARSALPMVGDFFQQALRNRWIDPKAEFAIARPRPRPPPDVYQDTFPSSSPETGPSDSAHGSRRDPLIDGIVEQLRGIFR